MRTRETDVICIFPAPYPDELLYSVCARYKDLMQYPNGSTATGDFFGTATSAVVDLPNKLEHLISALPPGHLYTVDEFIDGHTMLPFYAPFLSRERARALRAEMRGAGENQIFERLGLNATRSARPTWLRFCPLCADVDRGRFGETYWHRTHQLSGVEVCPIHAVFLEPTQAPFHNDRNPGVAISAESVLRDSPPRRLDLSDRHHGALLDIARTAARVLDWGEGKCGNDDIRERYYSRLLEMGLAYYNGSVRATELASRFTEQYPPQILEALNCKISDPQRNWLLRLLRSGFAGVSHLPIRHILLIRFLGCSVEEFFGSTKEYKPFGSGPWPCLNRAADHFGRPTITRCRVADNVSKRKKIRRPVGTFSCDCGFVYNRAGPDTSEEDRSRLDTVESYGPVWEQILRDSWPDTATSIPKIAGQLGVSGLTVVRYAIRLGLPMNVPGARRVSHKTIDRYRIYRRSMKEAVEHYRNEWLSVLAANPGASRTQLLGLASFLYLWLNKNDSEWLESHLPPVRKGIRKAELKEWGPIDIELAVAVDAAALRIRSTPGRPRRLTLAAIVREAGNRMWLEFRLHKLPLTAAALKSCLESYEQCLLRRVRWAEEYYAQKGFCPRRSYFKVMAGISNKSGKLRSVQLAVDAAMERLREECSQRNVSDC